jgi:adenylate kinase family enzyme
MQRVVVFGTSGAGKSFVAERLGARTGLRVIELDKLYWGHDWQPAPLNLFRYRVENEIRDAPGDLGWIVAGSYGQVRDLVWRAADTLVWLDPPLPLIVARLVRRSVRRIVTREPLWGTGNTETWRNTFLARDSNLYHAIHMHHRNRQRFAIECEFLGKEKNVVRLCNRVEVERFLATA